ncbi:MAG: GNAT family N-acetyltransferase [Opitutaceae bacterium]|nr:GNAT family N-acetyltransferase [Opitutaceae bacterium]
MHRVRSIAEVQTAIDQAKSGATDYCTNLFATPARLQAWVDADELSLWSAPGAVHLLRREEDFHHWYFAAANRETLRATASAHPALQSEPIVTDLVGPPPSVDAMRPIIETSGFRPYARLQRLSRIGAPTFPDQSGATTTTIDWASAADLEAVHELLRASFNRHAEQLPSRTDLAAAIASRQVLAARVPGVAIAGFLHFETQGASSTVRFWVVSPRSQGLRLGAALLRQYFCTQSTARRFTLWVNAKNNGAIEKYLHYGFKPDGLIDDVLANSRIPHENHP